MAPLVRSPLLFAWAALLPWRACGQNSAKQDNLNGPIAMPNLGRGFSLGALYDARTDQRIGGFLWPLTVLKDPKYVKEMNAKKSKYSMVYDDTYADKASLVEVGAELALKARASASGFGRSSKAKFSMSGSAEFMTKSKASSSSVRASVAYKLRSFQQVLDVFHPDIRKEMYGSVIDDKLATHVVAGVTYGSDCIATFTYKTSSLHEKTVASAFLKTKVKSMGSVNAPFNIAGASASSKRKTQVQTDFESKTFSTSSGVTVDILGDVLPFGNETLPMDVDEAISFLKRLHQHGIGDGGVPMDLTLIPIAWLDDKAAKLARKLASDKVDEALKVIVELDASLEDMNELLEIDIDGFIAWEVSVQAEIKLLESFRANITQEMSLAMDTFNDGGDTELVTNVFNAYYASRWNRQAVQFLAEKMRDDIINLKSFVSSMKEQAAVPTAEHFSDYMAPSLDQSYDEVYFLVLVGMNPSKHRSSMGLVKDFTAFAASLLYERSPTVWCKTATVDGRTSCNTNYYFGAIHFDSFCEQFCQKQYCSPAPRACSNSTTSSTLTFAAADRDAWCANPCTSILGFKGNIGPFRADNKLNVLPSAPTITGVTGADDLQGDPYRQKVRLHLTAPTRGRVNNYRVRVQWLVKSDVEGGSGWESEQRSFDTMEDTTSIVVRGLVAGRKYTFAVAGVNLVGVGPFSPDYRLPSGKMLKVAFAMVTIFPEEKFSIPRNNSGPTWKSFRIKAMLSMEAEEPIATLHFENLADGSSFDCEEYKDATTSSVSCLLKGPRPLLTDTTYEVTATTIDGDEILGRGNFTYEVQTGKTCYNTERELRLLCNATNRCVQSCDECKEVEIEASGAIKRVNTTEVVQLKECLSDVCPDTTSKGHQVWCPSTSAPFPCFSVTSAGTADCRANCHVLSNYNAKTDACALPCKLHLTGGLSQACRSVLPGDSCDVGCASGYIIGSTDKLTFTCPADNSEENYDLSHPLLSTPTCTASCSLVKCPAGFKQKSNPATRAGKTRDECCDEVECGVGKYSPTTECKVCIGATRRRRADTCTDCPGGYVPEGNVDDCGAYCKSVQCPDKYRDKQNKHNLGGTSFHSCCDPVECGAGYYVTGKSCTSCHGATRRRRSTECSKCQWSMRDNGNTDDCTWITSVPGFSRQSADCHGGDISNTMRAMSVIDCSTYCVTYSRTWCHGFSYHYSSSTCILKTNKCSQKRGSYSVTDWNFYKRR